MRISNKLTEALKFNPTKNTRQATIETLCNDIDNKKISLPLYQRALSWTPDKYVALLNYQLSGKAPVSPISVNVIVNNTDVPQVSFIDREALQGSTMSVVDGQQRLTTNYKAWINSSDFRNIVLDIAKGKFVIVKDEIRDYQIPAGVLLNKNNAVLANYIKDHSQLQDYTVQNTLLGVRIKIMQYNYTINSADDLSEDEQIQWFEVLNNAGTRISRIQLKFSKMKSHGLDVYSEYTQKFVEKLEAAGFDITYAPKITDVSYPIAALNPLLEKHLYGKHLQKNYAPIPPDTKQNQLSKLQLEDLQEILDGTLIHLDTVLDFIDKYNLDKNKRIDYVTYLIGYYVFTETPDEDFLCEWYTQVDFTNLTNSERRELFTSLLLEELPKDQE